MSRFSDALRKVDARSAEQDLNNQNRHDEFERESQRMRAGRRQFLSAVQAEPTPASFYAVWLYAYVEWGGKITNSHKHNFAKDGAAAGDVHDYERGGYMWLPTHSTDLLIPTGYGANSMELFILTDIVDISLSPSNVDDGREGWEYGHTRLLTLRKGFGSVPFTATTNQPYNVAIYPDIRQIIAGNMKQLSRDFAKSIESTKNGAIALQK